LKKNKKKKKIYKLVYGLKQEDFLSYNDYKMKKKIRKNWWNQYFHWKIQNYEIQISWPRHDIIEILV